MFVQDGKKFLLELYRRFKLEVSRPEGGLTMKRMTTRVYGKSSLVKGVSIFDIKEAVDRLAAIEDILGDEYELDRLRELVEADREGRCVVLPFKPPKWVYMCNKRFPEPAQAYYASAVNVLSEMEKGCVFGDTPEEAEAALKAREQDG